MNKSIRAGQIRKVGGTEPVHANTGFSPNRFRKLFGLGSNCEIDSIPDGSRIIDVRTRGEFSAWHYPGALNVPVEALPFALDELGELDRITIVYCHSGIRSSVAKRYLSENGFARVYNGGGLTDIRALSNV